MPINLQDDAEECLGEMFVSDMILNNLEVEEILKVDCIIELNDGCNIDLKSDATFYFDVGISGCLYLNQPLINLKNDSGFDDGDIGFYSSYQDPLGVTYYTGLVRDSSDGIYKLFDRSIGISNPCFEVDFTGISYSDLQIGRLQINNTLEDCGLEIEGTEYGDLMVGISGKFLKFDIGLENQVLTVDLTSPLGVTWAEPNTNIKGESGTYIERIPIYNYTRASSNITLIGKEKYTRLFRKKYYGAKHYSVINELEDGPMAFFNATKSSRDIDGHIVKLTGIGGYTGGLTSKWTRRVNIELGKCDEKSDGDYLSLCNYDPDCAIPANPSLSSETVLLGVTCSEINSATKGNFIYQVVNDIKGPVGIFYLTKNISGNVASIARISHSPSSDFNKLNMIWNPNSGIELCKTKTSFDGIYTLIPIHEQYLSEKIITLTEDTISPEVFIEDYERITTIVSVENMNTDGASAIFTVSKNHISNPAHVSKIVSSISGGGWDNCEIIGVDPPSVSFGDPLCLIVDSFEIVGVTKPCGLAIDPRPESIKLSWGADELLQVYKGDNSIGNAVFDGQYRVRIYDYFTC